VIINRAVHAEAVEFLVHIPDRSVGLFCSDPPFFISLGRSGGGIYADPWAAQVSSLEEAVTWTQPLADQISRCLRPGGSVCIMGGSQSLAAWELCAARVSLNWMAELTVLWNSGKPRARNFGSLSTSIRWYTKPGARHSFNSGEKRSIYSNVIVATKVPADQRLHPAQKPVELTNFLVSLLSNDDDLVVDPFAGSGSTLVSAAICGRRWAGCDNDPKFPPIINRRVAHHELEAHDCKPLHLWVNGRMYPVEA
jgi:site-specific DNA-methyltransferase (adenine-specific)